MKRGSVLVHAPVAAFQEPGGGEVQLVQTALHLEALGVPVRPLLPWTDRLEDARLLHLFGMSREGLELARVARARGVPVVLSPICWVEPRAMRANDAGRFKGTWRMLRWSAQPALRTLPGWRRELLSIADAILPNSAAEAHQLMRLFGAPERTIHVVPNGVERRFAQADPTLFHAQYGAAGFVLYAGRIEPRKNVRSLVCASRSCGLPLVVIGNVVPGHEAYAESCKREAGSATRWLPAIDHADPLLESAYAAARVFALPSWFETPSLSALEAGLAGCALVVTPLGCTREYFGELAQYARPDRAREIERALALAWEQGPHPALAGHIGAHYLWAHAAQKTAEVYDQVAG